MGSSFSKETAIRKSLSEAIERWAYLQYRESNPEEFKQNEDSSGFAAYPNFIKNRARKNALCEAFERWVILSFWEGRTKLIPSDEIQESFSVYNNNAFQDRIEFNSNVTNSSTENLGIGDLTVMGKDNARGSLDVLDKAFHDVSGQRAELGAVQNRLTSTIQNLQVSSENLEAVNSRIRDTDFAQETANNTKLNILNNVGTSVLGQANASGQAPQRLIS